MKASSICIDHEIKNGKPLQYPHFNFIKFRHGTDKNGSDDVIPINRIKQYSIEQSSFRSLYRFNKSYHDLLYWNGIVDHYEGVCFSDYLPFDFEKIEDARSFCQHLRSFDITDPELIYYFSGNGTFTIIIPICMFGDIAPSKQLPLILAETASLLVNNQPQNLYRKNSMIRIPNTVHERTGLYKVQLKHEELYGRSAADYKSLAQKPRELFGSDASHPNNTLVDFFAEAKASVQSNALYDAKTLGERYDVDVQNGITY